MLKLNLGSNDVSLDMIDAFSEALASGGTFDVDQCAALANWLCKANFDERTFIVGHSAAAFIATAALSTIDIVDANCKNLRPWNMFVCSLCLAHDFSSSSLDELIQECAASDIPEISIHGKQFEAFVKSKSGQLKRQLDRLRRMIDATSYLFYVADPSWVGSYRLHLSFGIKYPESIETLHIESSPEFAELNSNRHRSLDQGTKYLCDLQSILSNSQPLYQDQFCNVQYTTYSFRRKISNGTDEAMIYFAFPKPFTEDQSSIIGRAELDISEKLQGITADIGNDERYFHEKLQSLQRATYEVNDSGKLSVLLDSAISACFQALSISMYDSLATVSLFDQDSKSLTVVACQGTNKDKAHAHASLLEHGKGIVSWVAITRRSLRIPNLSASVFKNIHIDVLGSTQSSLAIPLMAGTNLVGVLNFDSRMPNAFSEEHCRLMWAFGSFLAAQLNSRSSVSRQYKSIRVLIEEFGRNAGNKKIAQRLGELAKLAKRSLDCDQVDIWGSFIQGAFQAVGSTDVELAHAPRIDGWSSYILTNKCPTWIYINKSGHEAFARKDNCWYPVTDGPASVNLNIEDVVKCELGIPFYLNQQIVAIMWLKYKNRVAMPALDDLDIAEYFAEKSAFFANAS